MGAPVRIVTAYFSRLLTTRIKNVNASLRCTNIDWSESPICCCSCRTRYSSCHISRLSTTNLHHKNSHRPCLEPSLLYMVFKLSASHSNPTIPQLTSGCFPSCPSHEHVVLPSFCTRCRVQFGPWPRSRAPVRSYEAGMDGPYEHACVALMDGRIWVNPSCSLSGLVQWRS